MVRDTIDTLLPMLRSTRTVGARTDTFGSDPAGLNPSSPVPSLDCGVAVAAKASLRQLAATKNARQRRRSRSRYTVKAGFLAYVRSVQRRRREARLETRSARGPDYASAGIVTVAGKPKSENRRFSIASCEAEHHQPKPHSRIARRDYSTAIRSSYPGYAGLLSKYRCRRRCARPRFRAR